MKTSAVSTLALQNLLRSEIQSQQNALQQAQTEASTGVYADFGLSLGAQTSNAVNLTNNVNAMQTAIDANSIADTRLSASQSALEQVSGNAQTALNALLGISGDTNQSQIQSAQTQIQNALQSTIGMANQSANGEYLFSGINTNTEPMNDYFSASGSAAKTAFDTAFASYFGFPQTDPQVSTITGAQMSDFIDTEVTPMFQSPQWEANWSNASDQPMTSRISPTEVVKSSTTTNTKGFQQMAMGSVLSVELLGLDLSDDARSALTSAATKAVGTAVTSIDTDRSALGVSQARISSANDSLNNQMSIVKTQINNLESVDPYDAATRVNTLTTQIETSYALTSRLSQLSLLNYL